MEIRLIGNGGRLRRCLEMLLPGLSSLDGELILLPIPTTKDNLYINTTSYSISAVADMIDKDSLVVGYDLPEKIKSRAEQVGARVFDASLDEKFQVANAKISAEGALGYILTHSTKSLADMKIGIVGYGRIGREMLRLCLFFGSFVRLYTARREVAIELGEMGIDARLIGDENDFTDLDVLVNTTPKRQIEDTAIPEKIPIIDLASGSIFDQSPRLVKLSSIPEAFYPETAGELYADAILGYISEEKL